VHFYDVSHGLAALVEEPGGAHVLIDTGDGPSRRDCGDDCARAHEHLMSTLRRDLGGASIDVLWITHQHSDHIGGAPDVLRELPVKLYVDNGRDREKPDVRHAHDAARLGGVSIETIDPSQAHLDATIAAPMKLTPVVPDAWPKDCAHDPNDCSIGLRIDFGASSILFTGDAEREEENALVRGTKVTLLQVGHHGSETSTSDAFLSRVGPSYAVISAGHRGTGMNADYCLPRMSTVTRLNRVLPGEANETLSVFDARVSCKRATDADWVEMPVSDRLWATERDGDVVLVTRGDGVFTREGSVP
jgi:competence protein ComEC